MKIANIEDPKHKDYIAPFTEGTIIDPTDPNFAKGARLTAEGYLEFKVAGPTVRVENPDGSVTHTTPIARTYFPNRNK
jgi:hypothetical protein